MNDLEKKNNVTMSDAKEEKEMIRENQVMEDNEEEGSKFIDEFSDKLENENDNESISRINERSRSMSSESKEESTAKYRDVLSGTSVNPTRRSSIASAAICSSLAPSLAGAFPGVPSNFLPRARETSPFGLKRSVTLSNLSFVNDTTLEVIDKKKEEENDDRINKERDRNDDGNNGTNFVTSFLLIYKLERKNGYHFESFSSVLQLDCFSFPVR
ncbi:uncharacterized protein LOC122516163 isoform X2 [Polistes fuscatus]|uniref:uncharacterized protein LOC122516163 isoform X2 n=1 Tax=Polistes fuscatus TaxID=30207 RepID=UPI001CA97944|nr:uncharacterized protein LOC122516163 isoform X2 [Polistes fuscatus]